MGAVGFVTDDDDVFPLGDRLIEVEFMDEGKNVLLIRFQEVFQIPATAGPGFFVRHGAHACKRAVNLFVQFHAVSHQNEGVTAAELPLDFLTQENHRIGLAAALGMPEHAQALRFFRADLAVFSSFELALKMIDGFVHPDKLMVAGNEFDQFPHRMIEQDEILEEVEQAAFFAHAVQDRVEADHAFFVLADAFPVVEMLEFRSERADLAFKTVAQQDDGIAVKQPGDSVFVVAQVGFVGHPEFAVVGFQFDENQRNAVDETEDVGALAALRFALDPHLLHGEEIVLPRLIEVEHADALAFHAFTPLVDVIHRDAVFQVVVFFLVEVGEGFGSIVGVDGLEGFLIRRFGQTGVESPHRPEKPLPQDHVCLRSPAQSTTRAEGLTPVHVRRFPFQVLENGDGGLFDEIVFGVGVTHSFQ